MERTDFKPLSFFAIDESGWCRGVDEGAGDVKPEVGGTVSLWLDEGTKTSCATGDGLPAAVDERDGGVEDGASVFWPG